MSKLNYPKKWSSKGWLEVFCMDTGSDTNQVWW